MKTFVFCEGLGFEKATRICVLPGSVSENLKKVKAMYKAAYCENGDKCTARNHAIPGGVIIEGKMIFECTIIHNVNCDYDYIMFEN